MKQAFVAVLLALAFVAVAAKKATVDPKECEVCKKVLADAAAAVSEMENKKDLEAIEGVISKVCKAAKNPKDKKLCYYIDPIKREVSRPLSNGVPVERICKRLKRSSPEICQVQYPMKMDKDVDVTKLRVKQLKKILADRGVACNGCIEKSDYVKKVQDTQHMEL